MNPELHLYSFSFFLSDNTALMSVVLCFFSCHCSLMIVGTPESFSLDKFGSSVRKLQSEFF